MRSFHKSNVDDDPTVRCNCCFTKHPHLDEFFGRIAKESTTHGVKYIGSRKLHPLERLFWTIVMLASLSYSIYLVQNIYSKYDASPVIISFQPMESQISQIPFPAITICNVNMMKASALFEKFDQVWKLNEEYESKLKLFTDPAILSKLRQQLVEDIVHLDHLAQFCLSSRNLRRRLNMTLQDAQGRNDYIQWLTGIIKGLNRNVTNEMSQVEEIDKMKFWRKDRELLRNATFACEDMLLECMWAGKQIPCTDIFFQIQTRNGRCCVFNMMPKFILQKISEDEHRAKTEMESMPQEMISEWKSFANDDLIINDVGKVATRKYPKHQRAGGRPYGLTVLANPNLHEYSTCTVNDGIGFKMVAHSPLSSPSIMDYGVAIPPSSEIFVDIEPQVTVANLKVLTGIPIKNRGCYLPSDPEANMMHYNYYSTENCLSECSARHTYSNCSCVRYFMPRNTTQKLCGAKDRECVDKVHANFKTSTGKNSFCNHCLPPCTEILYKLQLSQFEIRHNNVSSYYTHRNSEGLLQEAKNYSIIHIFMGTDSLNAMERKTLYQWLDLVSNAGGLLSLTLGVSILSFVEVGYYFTIRAWFQFRFVLKDKRNKNTRQN